MIPAWAIGALLGSGIFLLGYHIGRMHERQRWQIWLRARTRQGGRVFWDSPGHSTKR